MFLLAFNQDLKVQTFLLSHVSTSVGMTINVGVCGGGSSLLHNCTDLLLGTTSQQSTSRCLPEICTWR